MPTSPRFDNEFRQSLRDLLQWRRDVRRFRRDPLPVGTLERLVEAASLAPSVGMSQPWRFVVVDDPVRREAVRANFAQCNELARTAYDGEKAMLYSRLKLEGLKEAPLQIAVFADRTSSVGHGLGRRTMPQTIEYSVVAAIYTMWLVARAEGIGLGWVSILDAGQLAVDLDVPHDWLFVAYLCIGYPESDEITPELLREGWEDRVPGSSLILER